MTSRIRRHRPRLADGGALLGTVRQSIFLGEGWRYSIEAAGLSLTAKAQALPDAQPFAPGDRVRVGMHPASLRLLAPDAETKRQSNSSRGGPK